MFRQSSKRRELSSEARIITVALVEGIREPQHAIDAVVLVLAFQTVSALFETTFSTTVMAIVHTLTCSDRKYKEWVFREGCIVGKYGVHIHSSLFGDFRG